MITNSSDFPATGINISSHSYDDVNIELFPDASIKAQTSSTFSTGISLGELYSINAEDYGGEFSLKLTDSTIISIANHWEAPCNGCVNVATSTGVNASNPISYLTYYSVPNSLPKELQYTYLNNSSIKSYAELTYNFGIAYAIGYRIGTYDTGGRIDFELKNNSGIISNATATGSLALANSTGLEFLEMSYLSRLDPNSTSSIINLSATDSLISSSTKVSGDYTSAQNPEYLIDGGLAYLPTAILSDSSFVYPSGNTLATGISLIGGTGALVGSDELLNPHAAEFCFNLENTIIIASATAEGANRTAEARGFSIIGSGVRTRSVAINMVNSRIDATATGSLSSVSYGIYASDPVYLDSVIGFVAASKPITESR